MLSIKKKLTDDVKNEPMMLKMNRFITTRKMLRTEFELQSRTLLLNVFYNYKSVQNEETKKMIATLKALSTDPSIVILVKATESLF